MFSPTLEAMIPDDHPVRLFDEILNVCDWSSWEAEYHLAEGQPPIHPKTLAGAILYGLSLRIRSSRVLERMCANSIDFMWLVHGRRIDHSTFCKFRTRFRRPLKTLFGDMFRMAMSLGLARLNTVALDATRVRANSSRHATASAETLEERLAALNEQVEQMLREAEATDAREGDLFGEGPANRLPKKLADAQRRQAQLMRAMAAAKKKDAANSGEKAKSSEGCSVPVADPDSTVQPNKDGGYAPNYTPMVTAEGHGGFIADAEVLAGAEQPEQAVAAVDRVTGNYQQNPEQFLADSAYDSGETLAGLSARDVEPFIPRRSWIALPSCMTPVRTVTTVRWGGSFPSGTCRTSRVGLVRRSIACTVAHAVTVASYVLSAS
jgi:transposase